MSEHDRVVDRLCRRDVDGATVLCPERVKDVATALGELLPPECTVWLTDRPTFRIPLPHPPRLSICLPDAKAAVDMECVDVRPTPYRMRLRQVAGATLMEAACDLPAAIARSILFEASFQGDARTPLLGVVIHRAIDVDFDSDSPWMFDVAVRWAAAWAPRRESQKDVLRRSAFFGRLDDLVSRDSHLSMEED